jgi:uncharacterized RDD family membrane protein YckC
VQTGRVELASRRRRLAASAINGLIFIPAMSVLWLIWTKLPWVPGRPTGACEDGKCAATPADSPFLMKLLEIAEPSQTVSGRNHRSPGARLVGIRRVEAGTGGPISVRTAVIHKAMTTLLSAVGREAGRQDQERLKQLTAKLKEIRERNADDQEAFIRETMALYKSSNVNPFGSCLRPFAVVMATRYLPILLTRRRQSLPDLIAGIVVIRD